MLRAARAAGAGQGPSLGMIRVAMDTPGRSDEKGLEDPPSMTGAVVPPALCSDPSGSERLRGRGGGATGGRPLLPGAKAQPKCRL